jgi:hypothetical protein
MNSNTLVPIWSRLLASADGPIPPEMAHFLLGLRFPEVDQARLAVLTAKAQAGTLTPDERAENEEYLRAGHLLALLKSRARLALGPAGVPVENGCATHGQAP